MTEAISTYQFSSFPQISTEKDMHLREKRFTCQEEPGMVTIKARGKRDYSISFPENPQTELRSTLSEWICGISIIATGRVLAKEFAIIKGMYTLRGSDEVDAFLESNDYLIPLVCEAYPRLINYFPNSAVFMEVVQGELVISVGTALGPRDAKNQLYRFGEDWWLDVDPNLRSRLCITVEFQ